MRLALLLVFPLALQPFHLQQGDPHALWAAGRRVEAIEALCQRLSSHPREEGLRRTLAERQLEVHWYAAALQTLELLGPEADDLRAIALYRLARWEEALARLSPDDPAHALMRLEALEALGRETDAELARARSLLGAAEPRLLGFEGRARARKADHAGAVVAFRLALQADPLDGAALYGLGRSLIALGEREEGLQTLERHRALTPLLDQLDFARRSVDLAPMHAPNLAALGDAERALGRVDQAKALYERALALAAGAESVPIALRHARLLDEDRHDLDGAVRALENAAARFPDARLYVRAGDLLMQADRPIEAVQRFLKAGELRPSDPAIAARIEAARAAYRRDPGQ